MVITITGDNSYRTKAEITSVIDDFVAKHGALSVERFEADNSTAEQILSAVTAGSLLSPAKLVAISDYETNKELVERTEDLLAEAPEETTVLIIIGKLDKRLAYGKLLKKESDFREFNSLSSQEMIGWLAEAAKEKGGQIDRPTAQHLIDYVGADQVRLDNELDKLILFDPKVTRQTINELSERQPASTVFELLDAGFNGQEKQALRLYDEQRRLQVEPLAIVAMIGWQLHVLALVKTAKGKPAADIAKDAGIHPFVVQKSLRLAREMSLAKLRELVHRAVELETTMKSRTINGDDAVKHFLLSLTTS